jgi:ABC-type transport system substrate-binding protein
MMRIVLRFLLIPVLFGGLFSGCSEKTEPIPNTYSQLLTGTEKKTWKVVSLQIFDNGQGSGVIPAQNGLSPCLIDDLYTFYANDERKFELNEGSAKCNASNPDLLLTDSWTLVNADASLEFPLRILGGSFPWTIKNLTASVLTIEYYFSDINASYRFTFNSTTSK